MPWYHDFPLRSILHVKRVVFCRQGKRGWRTAAHMNDQFKRVVKIFEESHPGSKAVFMLDNRIYRRCSVSRASKAINLSGELASQTSQHYRLFVVASFPKYLSAISPLGRFVRSVSPIALKKSSTSSDRSTTTNGPLSTSSVATFYLLVLSITALLPNLSPLHSSSYTLSFLCLSVVRASVVSAVRLSPVAHSSCFLVERLFSLGGLLVLFLFGVT